MLKPSFATLFAFSGCPIYQLRLMLLSLPYVQPNRAFFFRKQACACPTTRVAWLVRTRQKKECGLREVWRSQTCTSGSPFFCLLFFGEAKKSKFPVGTRRMVKAAFKANHNALILF